MARRVMVCDHNTGEVLQEGLMDTIIPKRQHPFQGRWFAVNQDGFEIMENCRRVDDFRVFFALWPRLQFDNDIQISQLEIADRLGMKRQHVSSAIQRLCEAGVISKRKEGVVLKYSLDPGRAWKGRIEKYPKGTTKPKKSAA